MKDSGISTSQTSLILLKSNKTLTCAKEKKAFFHNLSGFSWAPTSCCYSLIWQAIIAKSYSDGRVLIEKIESCSSTRSNLHNLFHYTTFTITESFFFRKFRPTKLPWPDIRWWVTWTNSLCKEKKASGCWSPINFHNIVVQHLNVKDCSSRWWPLLIHQKTLHTNLAVFMMARITNHQTKWPAAGLLYSITGADKFSWTDSAYFLLLLL